MNRKSKEYIEKCYEIDQRLVEILNDIKNDVNAEKEREIGQVDGFNNAEHNEFHTRVAKRYDDYISALEKRVSHTLLDCRYEWNQDESWSLDHMVKNKIVDTIFQLKRGQHLNPLQMKMAGQLADFLEEWMLRFYILGAESQLGVKVDKTKPIYDENNELIGYAIYKDSHEKNDNHEKNRKFYSEITKSYDKSTIALMNMMKVASKIHHGEPLTEEDKIMKKQAEENWTFGLDKFLNC